MRDLPSAGDEFAGQTSFGGEHLAYPVGSQPLRWHLPEVSHGPDGEQGDPAGSFPGQADWAGSDEEDWPEDGGLARDMGAAPGDWPASGHPLGPRGGPGRRRGSRRLAIYAAAIVPALAAGLGIALVVTSSGASNGTFSANGANAIASVGTSPSVSTTSASASASTRAGASTRASAGASTNMGVEIGTGESGPDTLAGILAAADNSVEANGLLPPAKCDNYHQNAAGAIVCTSPVPGVSEIFYQNYSSLGSGGRARRGHLPAEHRHLR